MATIVNARDAVLQSSFTRTIIASASISSTSGRFLKLKAGVGTTPASITLTVNTTLYTVASVKTWEFALNTTPGNWNSLGTGNTKEITNSIIDGLIGTATQVFYRCTVTEFGLPTSVANYFLAYSVEGEDGDSAVVGQLSNDSHTVPTGTNGSISYTGCTTTMSVYKGSTDDSANWTYSVVKSAGVVCAEAITSRVQTVTVVTTDTSTVTITASRSGYSNIVKVFSIDKGAAGAVTYNLTNDSHLLPANAAGTVSSYTGCATTLSILIGTVDDSANWTYSATKSTGVTCTEAITSRTQTVTAVTTDVSTITITASKANYANVVVVFTITKAKQGITGDTGDTGDKATLVTAFLWKSGLAPSVPTQAFTYTWATKNISAFPETWSSTASASPGTGYSLYQLNLIIQDAGSATTTATNWSDAALNTLGYTEKGDIGQTGQGARRAYIVTTSATLPTPVTAGTYDVLPTNEVTDQVTGWSLTAPVNALTAGQYLYQVDGLYTTGGNIAWGVCYLSNLKVGSLSALTANLGVVNIATGGNLWSGKSTAASTAAGFFLGNDGGTPKFSIGSGTTDYLKWTGSRIETSNMLIKDSEGNTVLDTSPALDFNSRFGANTTDMPANNATVGATSDQVDDINDKLSKSSADIISGSLKASAFQSIWMSNEPDATNNGIYLGSAGIFGKKAGATTFSIDTSGNVTLVGKVTASEGAIGGNTIDATSIHSGTTGYGTGTGFYLGSDGTMSLGNKLTWSGSALAVNGDFTANTIATSSGKFAVSSGGILTATEANISGTITGSTITTGANFSVDINGKLIADTARIKRRFVVETGSITPTEVVLGSYEEGYGEGSQTVYYSAGHIFTGLITKYATCITADTSMYSTTYSQPYTAAVYAFGSFGSFNGQASTYKVIITGHVSQHRSFSNTGNFPPDGTLIITFNYKIELLSGLFINFTLPSFYWALIQS